MSFAKEVWEALTSVDVSPYVEKKGNLDYISWANCLGALLDAYPESTYTHHGPDFLPNETASVTCDVTVRDGEKAVSKRMTLPVMDYKNKAVVNPDSRDVNDASWRCFVKCCAAHGLGLRRLYTGEINVPEPKAAPVPDNNATEAQMLVIQDFADADKIPEDIQKWLDGRKWKITQNQAARLIEKLKAQEKGEQGNE